MFYTLSMRDKKNNSKGTETMKDLIKLIECFEDKNKFYWISKLDVCDSVKGRLTVYFNLFEV